MAVREHLINGITRIYEDVIDEVFRKIDETQRRAVLLTELAEKDQELAELRTANAALAHNDKELENLRNFEDEIDAVIREASPSSFGPNIHPDRKFLVGILKKTVTEFKELKSFEDSVANTMGWTRFRAGAERRRYIMQNISTVVGNLGKKSEYK